MVLEYFLCYSYLELGLNKEKRKDWNFHTQGLTENRFKTQVAVRYNYTLGIICDVETGGYRNMCLGGGTNTANLKCMETKQA